MPLRTLAGRSRFHDLFGLMRVEYTDEPQVINVGPTSHWKPSDCAKFKSSDFRHEQEIRVVLCRSQLHAARSGDFDVSAVPAAEGTYIRIRSMRDLMKHGVYASPRAVPWLHDTVQSVMKTYGQDPTLVLRSSLSGHFEIPGAQPFQHHIRYDC